MKGEKARRGEKGREGERSGVCGHRKGMRGPLDTQVGYKMV